MSDLEATVAALAARLQAVEDQLAITQLVIGYGPAVDSGAAEEVAARFQPDGVYDSRPPGPMQGREGIAAMVRSAGHQDLIQHGCAHVMGAPIVTVDGDRAVATGYSRVYRHVDGGFEVWRLAANRWELARTPDGWRVTYRVNRLLDGSEDARDLLRRGARADLAAIDRA
jgi:hypothetical protein